MNGNTRRDPPALLIQVGLEQDARIRIIAGAFEDQTRLLCSLRGVGLPRLLERIHAQLRALLDDEEQAP